jgi:hypothetical protein
LPRMLARSSGFRKDRKYGEPCWVRTSDLLIKSYGVNNLHGSLLFAIV